MSSFPTGTFITGMFNRLKIQEKLAKILQGKTPEEAQREVDEEWAERAQQYKDTLQYPQIDRPRLLEDDLPFPPDYAFWAAIVYMMRKEPKMLERLATKFMDTQARMVGSLAQAGAGNIITAYSHSFIIALMLEQNYMIRKYGADDVIASLNVLTAAQALTTLLQGFAVPEMITFATTGVPISPRAVKAK